MSVREITEDEIACYQANGWVKLERLIEPDFAAELLRVGKPRIEPARHGLWDMAAHVARDGVEPFRSLMFGECMTRNAQRLMARHRLSETEVAVRYYSDFVSCRRKGTNNTIYHQDQTGLDRAAYAMFWLALEDVTPEMGAMRFLSGVHHEGHIGSLAAGDLIDHYPGIVDRYAMSPPLHYRPGDATVHHMYTVHGAPANSTDRERWAYVFSYTTADALRHPGDGDPAPTFVPFDDEKYPIVGPRQPHV
jgi:ectoine hydroxylase-related dioxygenase (phytanoyl-CoA dioxygenase family)